MFLSGLLGHPTTGAAWICFPLSFFLLSSLFPLRVVRLDVLSIPPLHPWVWVLRTSGVSSPGVFPFALPFGAACPLATFDFQIFPDLE